MVALTDQVTPGLHRILSSILIAVSIFGGLIAEERATYPGMYIIPASVLFWTAFYFILETTVRVYGSKMSKGKTDEVSSNPATITSSWPHVFVSLYTYPNPLSFFFVRTDV